MNRTLASFAVLVGVLLLPLQLAAAQDDAAASEPAAPTPTSDGSQSNWLHFLTLSVGATIDSRP